MNWREKALFKTFGIGSDIQTLEVMEESLTDFPGAVVLISHDRFLMDQVCNVILSLGQNNERSFFASYSQFENSLKNKISEKKTETQTKTPPPPFKKNPKLSYKEQKELESMADEIALIEKKIAEIETALLNREPDLELYHELALLQKKHEALFERWEFLEMKKEASKK